MLGLRCTIKVEVIAALALCLCSLAWCCPAPRPSVRLILHSVTNENGSRLLPSDETEGLCLGGCSHHATSCRRSTNLSWVALRAPSIHGQQPEPTYVRSPCVLAYCEENHTEPTASSEDCSSRVGRIWGPKGESCESASMTESAGHIDVAPMTAV